MKRLFIVSSFLCAFSLCVYTTAFGGFSLFDGRLEISGWVENFSAFRLEDGYHSLHRGHEEGDYSLCRNTFQLETQFRLSDVVTVVSIYRGWYDAAYDIDDDLRKLIPSKERDKYRHDSDIRELYVDIATDNLFLRFGKQQIVWGESDGFRMADIINALDFSWYYFFPAWEDIRIPNWSADIIWNLPGEFFRRYQSSLEFVLIPNCFDRGFESTNLAPEGAMWNPMFPQMMLDMLDAKRRDMKSTQYAEYGIRFHSIVKGWDFHIFDFYTIEDNPVMDMKRMMAGRNPFRFERVNKVGGSFNRYIEPLKGVLRFECVGTLDEPLNTLDHMSIKNRDSYAYMVGFDRPTYIPWLNPETSFFISGQVFQKYYTHWDRDLATGDTSSDEYQTLITFLINTGYRKWTWMPQIFAMYDFSGEGWVNPQIEYAHKGLHWRVKLGAHLMFASGSGQSYFSAFKDNNNVYLSVKYQF